MTYLGCQNGGWIIEVIVQVTIEKKIDKKNVYFDRDCAENEKLSRLNVVVLSTKDY